MHEHFESLEKRCKKYHQKQMLRQGGIFVLGVIALGAALLWMVTPDEAPSSSLAHASVTSIPALAQATSASVKALTQQHASLVLAPTAQASSTPLRKDVAYEPHVDESYLTRHEAQEAPSKSVPAKVEPKRVLGESVPESLPLNGGVKMNTKKMDTLKSMLTRYKREPQYKLALKIARFHYESAAYAKASLWAKKANMIDKESDEAWIMYAKSEYARGNKTRAKEILRLYLANKSSRSAEMLLMTWREEE